MVFAWIPAVVFAAALVREAEQRWRGTISDSMRGGSDYG